MATRAFVFDCFGVLYNDAFKDFLDRNAAAIGDNVAYCYDLCNQSDNGTLSDDVFYGMLASMTGEDPKALKTEFHDTRHLNRGIVEIIRTLKPRYKIGMLSNAGRDMLEEFMAEHNIHDLFDVVIASSETTYVKPQREIFELLAERLELRLDEIFFIDDSATNVTAARSYGMRAHTYTTIAELQETIEGINSA